MKIKTVRLPVRMKLQGHLTGGSRSEFIMVHFPILCRAEITVYRNSSVVHRLFVLFSMLIERLSCIPSGNAFHGRVVIGVNEFA